MIKVCRLQSPTGNVPTPSKSINLINLFLQTLQFSTFLTIPLSFRVNLKTPEYLEIQTIKEIFPLNLFKKRKMILL